MSMTRDEIEKMTDADVDRYIAEKVMGWSLTNYRWSDGPLAIIAECAHAPSISLDQAIEAAEKVGLEQEGLSFGLVWNSASRKWMAGWGAVAGWVSHETPALAVCRAVIAAWEART